MEVTECPQCGAAATPSDRKCSYCKAEFFVSSLAYLGSFDSQGIAKYMKHYKGLTSQDPRNTEGFLGLGLCYLQIGTYSLAQKCFENVIDASPEVSQAYYYHALARIRGRRLMTLSLNEVREIEAYLSTGIQLGGEMPQCKLLSAMLKRDYYETNGMKVPPPNASQILAELDGRAINKNEIKRLRECVKVAGQEAYFDSVSVV